MKNQAQTLRFILGTAMAGTAIAAAMPAWAGCSAEPYIGSVCITAAAFCPAGQYLEANGQVLAISSNSALFALLGTTYGGNGSSTFALPDLRGRTPVGVGQGVGLSNITPGQMRGNENTTLAVNNLAVHNHLATFTPSGGGQVTVNIPVSGNTTGNTIAPDASHNYLAASPAGPSSAAIWSDQMTQVATVNGVSATATATGGSVTVGATGSGQGFSNVPPQLGLKYCIAVNGLFPQRP